MVSRIPPKPVDEMVRSDNGQGHGAFDNDSTVDFNPPMNLLVLGSGRSDFMGITILLNHLHLQEFKRNLPGAAAPRRKTGRVGAARYTDQACCSVGSDLHHREFGKTSWSQGVTRQIGWLNG